MSVDLMLMLPSQYMDINWSIGRSMYRSVGRSIGWLTNRSITKSNNIKKNR